MNTLLEPHNSFEAGVLASADERVIFETEQHLAQLESQGIGTADWWLMPRDEQYEKLETVIGHTPMQSITLDGKEVSIKAEFLNLGGSHYARAYLATIKHFESIQFLQPGDELRDISSGSAGISLALLSHLLGYKARIMVPAELPANRLYPMLHFGAQITDTGKGYVPHSSQIQAEEIENYKADSSWKQTRPADRSGRAFLFSNGTDRICYLNHSENELTPRSFGTIADEIIEAEPNTTHVVLAEGNWTTIAGIAPRLRQLSSGIIIVGYSGVVTDGTTQNFGTNVPDVPVRFRDPDLLDEELSVSDGERDSMNEVAPHLGRSSLMGIFVAQKILRNYPSAQVVTIGYDSSSRY